VSGDLLTARDKKMLGIAAAAAVAGVFVGGPLLAVVGFVGVVAVNKYSQAKEKR